MTTKTEIRKSITGLRAEISNLAQLVNDPSVRGWEEVTDGSREIAQGQFIKAANYLQDVGEFLGLDI